MTKDTIKEILAKQFDIDPLSIEDDIDLISLNADSLDVVEIVLRLEERFGIEIQEDEYWDTITVNEIANLVDKKLNKTL